MLVDPNPFDGDYHARSFCQSPVRILVATFALQDAADPLRSFCFAEHPFAEGPGRIVAHVLGVAAVELRCPMVLFILTETDYGPLHRTPSADIQ
jgi:hypothetical protein